MGKQLLFSYLFFTFVSVAQADEAPSADFWDWFGSYGDADGDVFDPIALVELTLAMQEQIEFVQEEVNPSEEHDDSVCINAMQSDTCGTRKD